MANKIDNYGGFGCPAVTLTYGPSGLGKSVDLIYSFPTGLFLAKKAALKGHMNVVGFEPESREVQTIEEATKVLQEEGAKGKFSAIVVDDLTLLAEQTVKDLEFNKRLTGFTLWGKIREQVLDFRNMARKCGMHVALNAHESAPTTKNNFFVRGGPKLPGKLPEELPGECDLVVRMASDKKRKGWHAVFRCTIDDPNYVTKDRHGVTPDFAPANTAEILRLAGYYMPRPDALQWMDNVVENATNALLEVPVTDKKYAAHEKDVFMAVAAAAEEMKANKLHTRWALRDIVDRASLRRARENVLADFGL